MPLTPPPVFPGAAWIHRTPREVGLDPGPLEELAARAGGAGCVVRHGFLAYAWGPVQEKRDWASAAKPVLSTLLLFAVRERILPATRSRVDERGWDLIEKDRTMTFRHLADMVSGYSCGEAPGAAWGYNDFGIQLYALALEKLFGEPLDAALTRRLRPLGLEDGSVFSSRGGRGVTTTPRDFARLGWLWLNRGMWEGQALLPAGLWSDEARPAVPVTLPRTRLPGTDYLKIGTYGGGTNQTPHGPGVYGLNFWFNEPAGMDGHRVWPALPPDTYQANGLWNRDTVTIIPSLGMVAAVRGAAMGAFEPGNQAGAANQALALLAQAVRS